MEGIRRWGPLGTKLDHEGQAFMDGSLTLTELPHPFHHVRLGQEVSRLEDNLPQNLTMWVT